MGTTVSIFLPLKATARINADEAATTTSKLIHEHAHSLQDTLGRQCPFAACAYGPGKLETRVSFDQECIGACLFAFDSNLMGIM